MKNLEPLKVKILENHIAHNIEIQKQSMLSLESLEEDLMASVGSMKQYALDYFEVDIIDKAHEELDLNNTEESNFICEGVTVVGPVPYYEEAHVKRRAIDVINAISVEQLPSMATGRIDLSIDSEEVITEMLHVEECLLILYDQNIALLTKYGRGTKTLRVYENRVEVIPIISYSSSPNKEDKELMIDSNKKNDLIDSIFEEHAGEEDE